MIKLAWINLSVLGFRFIGMNRWIKPEVTCRAMAMNIAKPMPNSGKFVAGRPIWLAKWIDMNAKNSRFPNM